jgi:hypothetical protein
MTRSSATHRAVEKWLLFGTAVAVLGCAPVGGRFALPSDWTTQLPANADPDPAKFRLYLTNSNFQPTGNIYTRARAGSCPPSLCTVNVTIEALGNTVLIDAYKGPSVGTPVARIQNTDPTDVEAYYGFEPKTRYVYYFWVDSKPLVSTPRLTLLRVPVGAGNVEAGPQKDLKLCHPRAAGDTANSAADFVEYRYHGPCTAGTTPPANMIEASFFPTGSFAALFARVAAFLGHREITAGGGWINCSQGCCT